MRRFAGKVEVWAEVHPWLSMSVVAAMAVVVHAIIVAQVLPLDHVGAAEMQNVARAILSNRGFADAFGQNSGPTAHVAPVYPLMLSALYAAFGLGKAGAIAQAAFGMAQVVVIQFALFGLAKALSMPPPSALFGAAFFILPVSIGAEGGDWEACFSALIVICFVILAMKLIRSGSWSVREAAGGGLFMGLALLVSPPLLVVGGLLFAIGFWTFRTSGFLKFAVVYVFASLLVLLPWIVRNYLVLGSPVWARSNLGLELSMSHNDRATVDWSDTFDSGLTAESHPLESDKERNLLIQMGEVPYNRERLRMAVTWGLAHPRREMELFSGRVLRFWLPKVRNGVLSAITLVTTLLAFVGLWRWSRAPKSQGATVVVGSLLLGYPLIYYGIYTSMRYRYPITPILILFAGDLLWNVVRYRSAADSLVTSRR